jgi:hypothetical protein
MQSDPTSKTQLNYLNYQHITLDINEFSNKLDITYQEQILKAVDDRINRKHWFPIFPEYTPASLQQCIIPYYIIG